MTHRRSATRPITDADLHAIADAARAHERSILRRVVGLPVRGRVAEVIDRELTARGIASAAADALPSDDGAAR